MTNIFKLGTVDTRKIYMGKGSQEIIHMLKPKTKLSNSQKFELINLITEGYYNTDNPTDVFACEYFYVIDILLHEDIIPLELEYLAIEEMYEEIGKILKEK